VPCRNRDIWAAGSQSPKRVEVSANRSQMSRYFRSVKLEQTEPSRSLAGRLLRATAGAGVALALLAGTSAVVHAHALPVASDPAPGAILQQPPQAITMTFNEAPDPSLSYMKVLDTAGTQYEVGNATANPGDPRTLTVKVAHLHKGVYTVAWRTVASDDGHRITGSWAFGVQVSPPPPVTTQQPASTSAVTLESVTARALFYIGLVALLGAAFVAITVAGADWRRMYLLLIGGCILSAVATIGITDAQLRGADVGWSQLFHTTLIGAFLTRGVPLLAVGGALVVAGQASRRLRRWAVGIAGIGAALSMLADSAANHASTEAIPAISVVLQWLHILAVGIWIGGLMALLLAISAIPKESRRALFERFGLTSIVCLLVIAVTGILRSIVAVGSWSQLFTTLYGVLILVKLGLVVVLAVLGSMHGPNIRQAEPSARRFSRLGSMQLIAAVAALVLSATLVNVAPPSAVSSFSNGPAPLVTTGTDGPNLSVRLEVTPGNAGFNHFTLTLSNPSTGSAINNASVVLGFLFAGRGGIGASSLIMPARGNGEYGAEGANLSLTGAWNITAQIDVNGSTYEVPLQLATRG
jgi:copper transport protein